MVPTPLRFSDLNLMLNDPSPAVRLEAIKYLEVLNRPTAESIPALTRLFEDPDLVVRVHAVRVAIRAGMPVQQGVPVARQLLVPNNTEVCCLAARILGDVGPPAQSALPQLRACLTTSSVWVQLHAARAVFRIDASDREVLDVLRRGWENERGDSQEFAVTALNEAVRSLAKNLRHDSPEVRLAAASRLEQLGDSATAASPALVDRFTDTDLQVRVHAARAAFQAGVPARQVVDVIAGVLDPESVEIVRAATLILAEIGPDAEAAIPKLHTCMKAPAIAIRLYAAEAALRIHPQDRFALEVLQSALSHHQVGVRYFAVNSLGAAVMECDLAAFALQQATSDSHPKVAAAAALQLSRTHDLARSDLFESPVVVSEYRESEFGDTKSWIFDLSGDRDDVREAAAIHLALAGSAARDAVPQLLERLGDSNGEVQLRAAQALWEIDRNGYPVLPVLVELLAAKRGNTRIGAAHALGRMGRAASDAVPSLMQLLRNSRSFDRLVYAAAIIRIEPDNDTALGLLMRGMRSQDADVRYLSTVALGAAPLSRQLRVEEALSAALDDVSARICHAAYESLSQLQVRNAVLRGAEAASHPEIGVADNRGTRHP